jgi:predicted HicB family RNase H-like nuclease
MKDIIIYKDFIGSVHFSTDDEVFYGKIEGINDLVTFEGADVQSLKNAFYEAVDDYIEICKTTNKEMHKSYKGTFNVRITPKLHQMAIQRALTEGVSLNNFVQSAIEHELHR